MSQPDWLGKVQTWRKSYEAMIEVPYRHRVERSAIMYRISNRMTTVAGEWQYCGNGIHCITLSGHMSESESKETFGHELCHLASFVCYGKTGHGKVWQRFMLMLNLRPQKYHAMPLGARSVICGIMEKLKP